MARMLVVLSVFLMVGCATTTTKISVEPNYQAFDKPRVKVEIELKR